MPARLARRAAPAAIIAAPALPSTMRTRLLPLLLVLAPLSALQAQPACLESALFASAFEPAMPPSAGAPCRIDSGATALGTRELHATDLDHDGRSDLLVAQAFNVDRITRYAGFGGGLFAAAATLDASLDDPVALASGDFDGDGRSDLASLTFGEGALRLHRGTINGLAPAQLIDAERVQGNALVAGDFDGVAGDDLVVIGQHSIDFYRSQAGGTPLREVILDTKTAPDVLECMALAAVDADGDGDLDVAVAETRGGVLYRNDGSGRFTPEVFTAQRRILRAIQVLDADGNALADAVVQVSSGQLMLYRDFAGAPAGKGELLFMTGPVALGSIAAVDLDGDGWQDLQLAFDQVLWHSRNLAGAGFATPVALLAEAGLFLDEVAAGDADGDGQADLFWSAANGRIGHVRAARPASAATPQAH